MLNAVLHRDHAQLFSLQFVTKTGGDHNTNRLVFGVNKNEAVDRLLRKVLAAKSEETQKIADRSTGDVLAYYFTAEFASSDFALGSEVLDVDTPLITLTPAQFGPFEVTVDYPQGPFNLKQADDSVAKPAVSAESAVKSLEEIEQQKRQESDIQRELKVVHEPTANDDILQNVQYLSDDA